MQRTTTSRETTIASTPLDPYYRPGEAIWSFLESFPSGAWTCARIAALEDDQCPGLREIVCVPGQGSPDSRPCSQGSRTKEILTSKNR
jgi:hypothetical protein